MNWGAELVRASLVHQCVASGGFVVHRRRFDPGADCRDLSLYNTNALLALRILGWAFLAFAILILVSAAFTLRKKGVSS